mgnify:CR=1 FL=1
MQKDGFYKKKFSTKSHMALVNKIRNDLVKKGDMMSTDDVTEILSLDLIGMIHDDTDIVISTNRGEPLAGANSYSSKIFMNILGFTRYFISCII